MIRSALLIYLLSGVAAPLLAAEIKYISDDFEITMRNGTSTSHAIVQMLRSGEIVTVIEHDLASEYSLVETGDGTQGYVLSRFLVDNPAAKQVLSELRVNLVRQQAEIDSQAVEIAELKQSLAQEQTDNSTLKSTLRASEKELSEVLAATKETLGIIEQNKQLQEVVNQLRQEKTELSETNAKLSDSTELDWFVRGGAVTLIAFVIGLLVTRISWKRRDSWGSY